MPRNGISGSRRGGFGRGVDYARGMVAGRGLPMGRGSGPIRSSPPGPYPRFPLFDPNIPFHKHRRTRGNIPSLSREQWHENQRSSKVPPATRTFRNRSLVTSVVDFYRVTLHRCKQYEKVMLFTFISDGLNKANFLPFGPKVFNNNWEFYVNDYAIAQQISELSEKITLLDGSKMVITVKPAVPHFEMNELTNQAITLALTNQYNCITKAANLAKFQNDDVFVAREMICSLNLNSVMINVTDILEALAADLVILNLDDNAMISLEETGSALARFPNLKVLSLARNKIRSVKELSHLKALKLEDLDLRGNGLEGSFRFRADYVREVRSMFPSLRVLDGEVLPKPISFDLDESDMGSIPVWRQNFVHESYCQLVSGFISLYFKYYDEPGRPNLMYAYHHSAIMSLVNHGDTNEGFSYSLVSAYQPYNRNLMMAGMRDASKSGPLMYQGPHQIVEVLKALPPTLHILETFTSDLVLFDDNLLQIVLTGLFKEFGNKPNVSGKPVKSFTRCFIMIREGNGFLIVNDSIVIRYPTHSQFLSMRSIETKRNMPINLQAIQEPVAVTTGMDIDEVVYPSQENSDSSLVLKVNQETIDQHNQNQLHYISPAISTEVAGLIKQEPIETLTENQPLDEPSPDAKRRKVSFKEANQGEETPFCDTPTPSAQTNSHEHLNSEGLSKLENTTTSSPTSCSSERRNILVSHLVTIYNLTPGNAETLLEMYKWDLEAILVAVNNKQIAIKKSP